MSLLIYGVVLGFQGLLAWPLQGLGASSKCSAMTAANCPDFPGCFRSQGRFGFRACTGARRR